MKRNYIWLVEYSFDGKNWTSDEEMHCSYIREDVRSFCEDLRKIHRPRSDCKDSGKIASGIKFRVKKYIAED